MVPPTRSWYLECNKILPTRPVVVEGGFTTTAFRSVLSIRPSTHIPTQMPMRARPTAYRFHNIQIRAALDHICSNAFPPPTLCYPLYNASKMPFPHLRPRSGPAVGRQALK